MEGMCGWIRLATEGLSLRSQVVPVLWMPRELLYEMDLKQVSNARPQAVRLTSSPRSMGSIPGNAVRGEFSCLSGAAGVFLNDSGTKGWTQ